MGTRLKLVGARVAVSASRAEWRELFIEHVRIRPFGGEFRGAQTLDLSGYLLLPGLINAHDLLEFNLFPRLGCGPYRNATEWAADIYRPHDSPVREHRRIPKSERLIWGGLKNLLSGVTTVAHHNAFSGTVFTPDFPVRVVERYGWAHSLAFGEDLVARCRQTPREWPFLIHAAEGTDELAAREIRALDELGLLDDRMVVVHAVGASARDRTLLRERSASMVWCPTSNLFTLGRTLDPAAANRGLDIALGTDSGLTAEGDLIDEMRAAREFVSTEALYSMVTNTAAKILRLDDGRGAIAEHGTADLVAVRDHGDTPVEALARLRPEMVLVAGRVRMVSEAMARHHKPAGMQPIEVEGRGRYLVDADVASLHASAARLLGCDVRLAGRRVRA